MDNTLGKKLTEIYSDKKIIIVTIIIRLCIITFYEFAILGYVKSTSSYEEFFDTLTLLRAVLLDMVMLGFCFFPLIHINDYLFFYEEGICYNGKIYMLDSLFPLYWQYSGIPIPFLWYKNEMVTKCKVFNISYMKNVEKQFNTTYMYMN